MNFQNKGENSMTAAIELCTHRYICQQQKKEKTKELRQTFMQNIPQLYPSRCSSSVYAGGVDCTSKPRFLL
jgi:phage anti-repressor protein